MADQTPEELEAERQRLQDKLAKDGKVLPENREIKRQHERGKTYGGDK